MINKAMIDKMLEMPDDKLITMLRIVLSGTGVDIPAKKVDGKTVSKIRAVLSEVTDDDIERVMYLADRYKNGGQNGKQ